MKLHRTFLFNPALCGIVPLINVLFLVLVFYSMGSRFILQPGFQITLPETSYFVGLQSNSQIVSLTAGPNPSIYYRDQRIAMDSLLARLDENRAAERTLIIKADRNSPLWLTSDLTNEATRRGYRVLLAGEAFKR